jgi:hypothetical protein
MSPRIRRVSAIAVVSMTASKPFRNVSSASKLRPDSSVSCLAC